MRAYKIHEVQGFKRGGNQYKKLGIGPELYKHDYAAPRELQITDIEHFIWHKNKIQLLINEWDNYTEEMFDESHAELWEDLSDVELREIIEYGLNMLRKYNSLDERYTHE